MADYKNKDFNEILAEALKNHKKRENIVLLSIEDIEHFRDELKDCEGGDSYLIYQGQMFCTDVGYAFEGIDMLIECLKIKYRGCGDA